MTACLSLFFDCAHGVYKLTATLGFLACRPVFHAYIYIMTPLVHSMHSHTSVTSEWQGSPVMSSLSYCFKCIRIDSTWLVMTEPFLLCRQINLKGSISQTGIHITHWHIPTYVKAAHAVFLTVSFFSFRSRSNCPTSSLKTASRRAIFNLEASFMTMKNENNNTLHLIQFA